MLYIKDFILDPLTKEETIMYFERYQNKDKDARDVLISHNLSLVLYILKEYKNTQYEISDLFSVGLIGLIKAVDTYKIEKNNSFAIYAMSCIRNEILMFLRKSKKHQKDVSLEATFSVDSNDNSFDVLELIPDEKVNIEKQYEEEETISELHRIISKLEDEDKKIICMYFGINLDKRYKQSEIAKEFNVTQSLISQRIKKILEQIRTECRNLYILKTSKTLKK